MTFKDVAGRYQGPDLEQNILNLWNQNNTFQKSLERNKGKTRFSFCEGPPTANGKPGIHHVLARTFKDIYPRYKTMQGFYVPRKAGWDTHGLPVEHQVEKKLNIFDKKRIEEEVGVAEFTRLCRESVFEFIGDWEKMTERMGYWVDLDEAYSTLNNSYIESVWNLLKQIWDKGLLYQGHKVVPYDPRIGATLSSHEVAQGYKEVEDPAVTVKFELKEEENTFFIAWTTTPWTLPSNLFLAVNPKLDYAYVKTQDHGVLIMAASRVIEVMADDVYEVIKTVKGEALVGKTYHRLFDYLDVESDEHICKVYAGDFVTDEDGTGVVHCAPAYGADDLKVAEEAGIPLVHGVGLDGYFKQEVTPVAGKFFKDADPTIIEILTQRHLLLRNEKCLHNYPFGWRTGDPIIYYAKPAWYIRTTDIKDKMVTENNEINWVPETIKEGRFGNWLENNIDWALSRERFWGTPLPLWTDNEGEFHCIGSLKELSELVGRDFSETDLHRPAVDDLTFEKNGKTFQRVPEVIDCWFDSGAMSYAQWHYPFENKDQFEAHFPADYICEAIDQTRGWFYTLHAVGSLISEQKAYKNVICLSHIVDANGKKMSKSQGNIINPYEVFDTVGADPLRWYFLARIAPEGQKRISVDIIRDVASSFVNTLWNSYAFFVLYANLDDFDANRSLDVEKRPEIDRWMLALLNQTIETATKALDNYDAQTAGQAIESCVDQLSNWYIRRNRRRFWKSKTSDDKQAAYLTLYECLVSLSKLIAPFMPFVAEELYQNLVVRVNQNDENSVHLCDWPQVNAAHKNDKLVADIAVVQRLVSLGRSAREQSKVRVRQPLGKLLVRVPDESAKYAAESHQEQILEELNVKSLEFIARDADLVTYRFKPKLPEVGKKYGKLIPQIRKAMDNLDGQQSMAIVNAVHNEQSFDLSLDDQVINLQADEVIIETESAEGVACAEEHGYLVGLDTELNEDLIVEGLARELVRTIQDARKQAGLEVADRINLAIAGSDRILKASQMYADFIKEETLADSIQDNLDNALFNVEKSLENDDWQIALDKV